MRVFQQLLFSHLVSGATMVVPRTLIGRVRPRNSPDDPYVFRPFDGTSFPSGHASTIFEVARVVSNALDWWPATAALYGMAGTVAYQRMVEETDPETGEVTKGAPHWPSDVYFGAGAVHVLGSPHQPASAVRDVTQCTRDAARGRGAGPPPRCRLPTPGLGAFVGVEPLR
jgi:hypothetical protein